MAQNDYQKMASTFLDMWQQQLTRTMNDRDMVKSMMQAMQQMQQPGASAFKDPYESQHRHTAPASGAYDDELVELAERLADCEQRIAALEDELEIYKKPVARATTKPNPANKSKAKSKPAAKPKAKPAAKKTRPAPSRAKRQPSTGKPAKTGNNARSKARENDSKVADKAADDAIASLKKAVMGTANRGSAGKSRKR